MKITEIFTDDESARSLLMAPSGKFPVFDTDDGIVYLEADVQTVREFVGDARVDDSVEIIGEHDYDIGVEGDG